jgi:tetraacyldisaccharide 4'-kinase
MKKHSKGPLPAWLHRSILISILSGIYNLIISLRNRRFDTKTELSYKVSHPVISIGGIRAGGTGKTPVTLMTAKILQSNNYGVAFLSRGYRRKSKSDYIVKPNECVNWELIGDEPAMLHTNLPDSWMGISAKRVKSAISLQSLTPKNTIFLLDDGFQHRKLKRDLDIVCIDESTLNDKLIPKGYLREPIGSLKRAHVLLITGSIDRLQFLQTLKTEMSCLFSHLSIFILLQKKDCWVNAITGITQESVPLKDPLVLCGIAKPERFLTLLQSEGINTGNKLLYSDHHNYTDYDINFIQKLYSNGLVTTEKDATRLLKLNVVSCNDFWYLKIKLDFENNDESQNFNRIINHCAQSIQKGDFL